MEAFVQVGQRMVELGVSREDLEARINQLQIESGISTDQAKAIVTGYVDALLKFSQEEEDLYELVHGFARFLYNGDFAQVRQKVLQKIALGAEKGWWPDERIQRFFQKDQAGQNFIAENLIAKKPVIAYVLYKGEKRPEVLRKIIAQHSDSKEARELIFRCYEELKDINGLCEFARKLHDPKAEKLLLTHGTTEDKRKIMRKARNIEATVEIALEHGSPENKRELARELRAKNLSSAYKIARDLLGTGTAEDRTFYLEVRQQLIQENPMGAFEIFSEVRKNYDRWESQTTRTCNDKAGMLEVARSFMKREEYAWAVYAFALSDNEGSESEEAAFQVLKKGQHEKLPEETQRAVHWLLPRVAIRYFNEGGDPRKADQYIEKRENNDDLNRRLSKALAKLPDDEHASLASQAYERLCLVRNATEKDRAAVRKLRKRILEQQYAGNFFAEHRDEEGMRAFIDLRMAEKPEYAYKIARQLKDETYLGRIRQNLIDQAVKGKMKTTEVMRLFEEAQDTGGIAGLRQAMAPGVDENVATTLLARPEYR